MSMSVRRIRRRSILTATLAIGSLLAAAVTTAAPAAAVANGFDPQAAPVTIPNTSTVVNEWKLVGRATPSAVQIAPQWILASGHAPIGVGGTFTNAYGSATVDRLAGVCGPHFSGCDISVSHLSTPINAPAYPALLQDGVPEETGKTPAGDTLAVGMGGSTLGRPDAAWTQPTGAGIALSTLEAGTAAIDGDSGGAGFFYRHGATTGVLQGLMTTESVGVASGLQQFSSARVKPFLDGMLPAGTVNWVTYDQLGPRLYRPETVANPGVTSTTDSVTLTWPTVAAAPAVVRYRAVLIRTDDVHAYQTINTPASTHTATFSVPAGVTFGAFVLATNANGESRVPWVSLTGVNPPVVTYATTVAAGPPPAGVRGLDVTSGPGRLAVVVTPSAGANPALVQTELVVTECNSFPCSGSAATPIADTTFSGTRTSIALPANTTAGRQFQLVAREHNSSGVSPDFTTTATYVPRAAPLPPTSVTVAPQADGTAAVSFVPAADPGTAGTVLHNYLPHAAPDTYLVRIDVPGRPAVNLSQLTPDQQDTTFSLDDVGLTPGTYTVEVLARSFVWGDAAPVAVTAALGGVAAAPPAPVTAVRTPSAPRQPANLVVPPVEYDGWNQSFDDTMTWSQPAPGPGQAAPDEYLITMQDRDQPDQPPTVVEVPGTQLSYSYQVGFPHQYTVSVYALSQQAGASTPATVVAEGPGL